MRERRHNLEIAFEVYQSLYPDKEKSVNALAREVKSEWKTVMLILEFYKKIKIVKERLGNKTKVKTRLFSLVKK